VWEVGGRATPANGGVLGKRPTRTGLSQAETEDAVEPCDSFPQKIVRTTVALRVHLHSAVAGERASRSTRRCSAKASAYESPSSCRSLVEPSMSVKRKVTVPLGRSSRTRLFSLAGLDLVSSPWPQRRVTVLAESAIHLRSRVAIARKCD
jgi:hypothetical protein